MRVDLTVTGGAPRWAEEAARPPTQDPLLRLEAERGRLRPVRAGGRHALLGHFTPTGQTRRCPRVHFWAIFNEPNFGEDLGPQAIKGSTVSVGPMMYRGLVNAGYKALQATGHGRDTILIGEFAARGIDRSSQPPSPAGVSGQLRPDQAAGVHPHAVLRRHQLSASCAATTPRPAAARPTPPARAASAAQNPGLFNAAGSPTTRTRTTARPCPTAAATPTSPPSPTWATWAGCWTASAASTERASQLPDLQRRVRLHHPPAGPAPTTCRRPPRRTTSTGPST